MCASKELASLWADNLIEPLRRSWEKRGGGSYFRGTPVCFSSLLGAERYQELLELLETAPSIWWEHRRWGVRALLAMGRADEAIRYAEAPRGLNDNTELIARACEEILLSLGLPGGGLRALRDCGELRTLQFSARLCEVYRARAAADPARFVARTPGQEGKWFAAAKEAGLLEMAIGLANQSPCDPKTLTRAGRDFIEQNPVFALEAGLAALRWLGEGFGYEVSGVDVWAAYSHTINAAERVGRCDEVRERVRTLVTGHRFLVEVLGRELGLIGKTDSV